MLKADAIIQYAWHNYNVCRLQTDNSQNVMKYKGSLLITIAVLHQYLHIYIIKIVIEQQLLMLDKAYSYHAK